MTLHNGPIQQLTRHLADRSAGEDADDLAAALAAICPEMRGMSPIEVAQGCHRSADATVSRRVVALLARLCSDELACLTLLVALRPALAGIARLLATRGADEADAEAEVLSIATEHALGLAGTYEPHAAERIVTATRKRCMRELAKRGREEARREPLGEAHEPLVVGGDPAELVSTLLADAARRGVVTAAEVEVVVRSRIEGECLAYVAIRSGRSLRSLYQQRLATERALRVFARAQ